MTEVPQKKFEIIVIGASQGGFVALKAVLGPLPADFPIPILVVRHQVSGTDNYIIEALSKDCPLKIKFAENNDRIKPSTVYIAPPDRHLLVGNKDYVEISSDKPVNFSRPSIDSLFKSAAKCYGPSVLAVIMTGANNDGTAGVIEIKKRGGTVIVQDPDSAESDTMPKSALAAIEADYLVWGNQIGPKLWELTR
ncbi:MAG: chemotaxis protein CheB [Magnetococcales bacterium]|nr:chemotaxis protein CheB [Magnetococcales bacterium]